MNERHCFFPTIPTIAVPRPPDFVPALPSSEAPAERDHPHPEPHPQAEQPPHTRFPEQGERLKVTGRIGRTPTYQTFANGNTRIAFPLGEHLPDGTTTWHRVYSTNRFADRIHAKHLSQGDLVEVAGTRQFKPETNRRTGAVEEIPHLYAWGVTPR